MNTTRINTKKMVANAILIAIGAILHQITPALGMQSDFSLIMLFIIIVYNKDYKTTLTCGIIIGIFAALTSKTPGGQLPNIIDKFITCNIMYLILIPLRKKISKITQISILLPVGTLLSGTTFLTILAVLVGLPGNASFGVLFAAVVLPTMVINTIIGIILFKLMEKTVAVTGIYVID